MEMIKHRVEISVTRANDSVLKLKHLTVKNLILNLLLGTKLMLLVPGESVETVSIKEVEASG